MKWNNIDGPSGTWLQGKIVCTYADLLRVFGPPRGGPDYRNGDKVTCEWNIKFEDGTVATIYDWRESQTPKALYDWHIGGFSERSTELVLKAIAEYNSMVKIN